MRNRPILRPQFETMESLTLLSSLPLSTVRAVIAQIDAQPQATTGLVKIAMTGGYMAGDFVRRTTAKTVTFTLTKATMHGVIPLQSAAVSGSLVYNYKGVAATSLQSAAIRMTVGRKNSITMTLTLPKGSNPNTQHTCNYKITQATGESKGNNESGQVTFNLLASTFSAVLT